MQIATLRLLITLVFTLGLWAAPTWANHDGQEDICHSAAVIFCDNFEARATGTPDLLRPIFKNLGWHVDYQPTRVTTSEHFDGAKAIDVPCPAGANVCGNYTWTLLPPGYQNIYLRWYTKHSANWVWSSVGGKHFKVGNDINAIHMYARHSGEEAMRDSWGVTPPWYTYTAPNTPDNIMLFQQRNLVHFVPGTWYCLEVHVKTNSAPTLSSTADGVVEAWVNDVNTMSYTGLNLDRESAAGPARNWSIIWIDGYWNCASDQDANGNCNDPNETHPAMSRYHDNFVVSTQRIGCLGSPASSDTTPPNPPSQLLISSLWDWLLSMFGTIFSG